MGSLTRMDSILSRNDGVSAFIGYRVATDLENLEKSGNLKETSESQEICDTVPKVREKSWNLAV